MDELLALKQKINAHYLQDEEECLQNLIETMPNESVRADKICFDAKVLVENVREKLNNQGTVEALIHEYDLSSDEGVVLMCLAEALLRIPDSETANKLIRDKIVPAKWQTHLGHSHSLFVNASTWGLMLTGKLIKNNQTSHQGIEVFSKLISRAGEPFVRGALRQAMKLMGSQYVMGETIESALVRSQKEFHQNNTFSYDMLGEAAITQKDALRYFESYKNAITHLKNDAKDIMDAPGISIKLSALHPRYEIFQKKAVLEELVPRVLALVKLAKDSHVGVTLDAEEADRLALSLEIFEQVKLAREVVDWDGFGLAVQAYQKRAYHVLEWLNALAENSQSKIPVRLVKGAYWDTEVKRAQESGLSSYPVFTRKNNTDVSYLVCANFILKHSTNLYGQFATHNAHSIAFVREVAGKDTEFEFQRLHGMGESLYASVVENQRCRVYSPVGSYKDLLPYLVRRLLENGANTSFINRIEDDNVPVDKIVRDPLKVFSETAAVANPAIELPPKLYLPERENSPGVNLGDEEALGEIYLKVKSFSKTKWLSKPVIDGLEIMGEGHNIFNPASRKHKVGTSLLAGEKDVQHSIESIGQFTKNWRHSSLDARVEMINRFAESLHENRFELYSLCVYESGKSIRDAISELREAIDFCHYYASQAEKILERRTELTGPTGEKNSLFFQGRGVFVCISPWNFPAAIFVGQIVAALVTGNCVIAKPSGNASLIAAKLVQLLYQAGIPKQALHFLPANSSLIESKLLTHDAVSGVAFTGSLSVALKINRTLAERNYAIAPLIAETGGMNVMIVDSSALPEQVIKDVLMSAFNSAGQRCSALRVLILQEEIYDSCLQLLVEAMKELRIGDPASFSVDVPPVIDNVAKEKLDAYRESVRDKLVYELAVDSELLAMGNYVSPAVYRIEELSELSEEKFGPILHVMSFKSTELESLVEEINETGYGLTLGIHSRIEETIEQICENAHVGNIYVNRNMVGAVVGVQPFGGEGLSGTGPKAGGPQYLPRFCTEKTLSNNIAAIGGNAALLSLNE